MNHGVDLVALEPGMLCEVRQKPQREISVLVTQGSLPKLDIFRLPLLYDVPAKCVTEEFQNAYVIDMSNGAHVDCPLGRFVLTFPDVMAAV